QQWDIVPTPFGDYQIKNAKSGMLLTVNYCSDAENMTLSAWTLGWDPVWGGLCQHWHLQSAEFDGSAVWTRVTSTLSGRALDAHDCAHSPGTPATICTYHRSWWHQWQFVRQD